MYGGVVGLFESDVPGSKFGDSSWYSGLALAIARTQVGIDWEKVFLLLTGVALRDDAVS